MKNLKLFKNLILFVFCIFFLCGCASIEHIRFFDEADGTVMDTIAIVLDTNKIPASTLEKLDVEIKEDLETYQSIASEVAGVLEVNVPETNKYTYVIQTKFASVYAINTLYGSDIGPFSKYLSNKQKVWAEEYTPFLYKYQPDESNSILWAIKYQGINGENFYNKYYEIVTGEEATKDSFSTEYLNVYQSFLTNIKDIHSNADKVIKNGDKTQYVWDLTDKSLDYQLEIYGLRARTSAWYIVGLILSFILIIVLVLIILIKNKKKKQIISKEVLDTNKKEEK